MGLASSVVPQCGWVTRTASRLTDVGVGGRVHGVVLAVGHRGNIGVGLTSRVTASATSDHAGLTTKLSA